MWRLTTGLPVLVVLIVMNAQPGAAQQGQGGSGDAPSVIDLPLIGTVELPGFLSFLGRPQEQDQSEQQPPPAVVFTTADMRPVGDSFSFIGRIAPIEQVSLVTRVPGFIDAVDFEGGQNVQAGDTLFQIDPAPYQAELRAAQAELESAQAQEVEAERALARNQELRESGTVSQSMLDDARAAFQAARGMRLQADAAVDRAQLNVDYTTILAPIDGRMSAPNLTRGNYVTASSGPLAELVQLDPIWGVFALGETRLATWRRLGIGGSDTAPVSPSGDAPAESDAEPLKVRNYDLTLRLPDGSAYATEGDFDFIGNSVDATTGSVEVRVRFANPDSLLLPNQNVTLHVTEANPPIYPAIPQSALQLDRDGTSVWVLQDDDTVRRATVQTTATDTPGMTAVISGLDGGARVIVRGASQLQDGQTVDPRSDAAAPDGAGNGAGGAGE
ncbi:efflux RND transporter periplasmic adaptor subunit [Loktanella sp. SALINAS62]|uniref:efflux RND transporter periplasmic adaptor subunit n=1 Tax=Loktanella sp. SALINAS62 TaxID=2706124 RepID=UPI001B8C5A3D|nr:efflux RND transporter periplasmic adaptor subunit [Loktanella sp. SALINAS62]MBS1302574.1 efflux RND transporter periplasmic adaptor subunit [Loktanella sp. SALINAS62]